MRRGLCRGSGKQGYYNIVPKDPMIHSMSAKGISTRRKPQPVGTNLTRLKWNDTYGLREMAESKFDLANTDYCKFHNTWNHQFFKDRNLDKAELSKLNKEQLINLIRDYEIATLSEKKKHTNLYASSKDFGLSGGLGELFPSSVEKSDAVPNLDLKRYAGTWHNQASIPKWFDEGCNKQVAEYKLEGDKIAVTNKCYKNNKLDKSVTGTAYQDKGGELKVSFFPTIYADYDVIYIDKDYQHALVGNKQKDSLWVLTRAEKVSDSKLKELIDKAKSKGYDTSKVKTLKASSHIHILSAGDFNTRFASDYSAGEIGYATTKVSPDGKKAEIYVKDSGNAYRNKRLALHEKTELKIYKKLIKKGIDPSIADELAHNLNPVHIQGVDRYYPLNPNN